jgi:E3 ubiquitin ligase
VVSCATFPHSAANLESAPGCAFAAALMFAATIFLASDLRWFIWPLIGAGTGVYFFYKGFRLLQRKRLIVNTPASKIRSASMGLVEISGLATGPYVVTSPLRQVECYYYQSTAWELQGGKNKNWVKVADESLHVPFYVDDSTDKVLIDPRGSELDLHCDFREEYHRSVLYEGPEMPSSVQDFLLRHGVDPDKRLKVEEHCIKPKNFLFVLGTLSQNPGVDASVAPAWAERVSQRSEPAEQNEPEPEVIRLSEPGGAVPATAMTQQQKIAAALSRAGISNPISWTRAPIAAPAATSAAKVVGTIAAETAVEDMGGYDLHPPVVLMKGSHEPTFFISWRSQRDVVASLGWKSGLMIWGGPALTILCVYILLAGFGRR